MSLWHRIVSLAIACVLPLAAAWADDTPATLDLNPATVTGRPVSDQEPLLFHVRLKAGSQDLKDISISAFSNDDIQATPEGPAAATVAALPAKAEQLWTLKVTPSKPGIAAPGALSVNVGVAFKEGASPPLQRYLFGTLSITAPAAVALPTLAEIEFKGSLEPLSNQRSGLLFVTVTNKYSQALEVTDIKVSAPAFISARPGTTKLAIPYGDAALVPITVEVADRIVPGKYPLVVVASLKTPNGLTGTAVKSQDAEIGVLGESDVLSKIGAPSMLFLPGVLFLLAWQLLWSLGKTDTQRQAYPLKPTEGGFWVVAVAIALIFAYVYPGFAGIVTGQPRDYLVAYGFKDYALLFALAIGSAAVLYVLRLGQLKIEAVIEAHRIRQSTPNRRDEPIDILRKLAGLDQTAVLAQAHPAGGNPADIVYILDVWSDASSVWIVPPAMLEDGGKATAASGNRLQEIVAGTEREAKVLEPELRVGIENSVWTLKWKRPAVVEVPRKDPAAHWTRLTPAIFIREP